MITLHIKIGTGAWVDYTHLLGLSMEFDTRLCNDKWQSVRDVVKFDIVYESNIFTEIFNATQNVYCQLKDGANFLFTGIIQPLDSAKVSNAIDYIDLEAEDYSGLLDQKIDSARYSNKFLCAPSDQSNSIVHLILAQLDIPVTTIALPNLAQSGATNYLSRIQVPVFIIDADKTVFEILRDALWQYGWGFRFDEQGRFTMHRWVKSYSTVDHYLTDANGRIHDNSLSIKNADRKYGKVELEYYKYKERFTEIYTTPSSFVIEANTQENAFDTYADDQPPKNRVIQANSNRDIRVDYNPQLSEGETSVGVAAFAALLKVQNYNSSKFYTYYQGTAYEVFNKVFRPNHANTLIYIHNSGLITCDYDSAFASKISNVNFGSSYFSFKFTNNHPAVPTTPSGSNAYSVLAESFRIGNIGVVGWVMVKYDKQTKTITINANSPEVEKISVDYIFNEQLAQAFLNAYSENVVKRNAKYELKSYHPMLLGQVAQINSTKHNITMTGVVVAKKWRKQGKDEPVTYSYTLRATTEQAIDELVDDIIIDLPSYSDQTVYPPFTDENGQLLISYQATLNTDFINIQTDYLGENGNYSQAASTVKVMYGNKDDTLNWICTCEPSAGVTGSQEDYTYTVTAMSTNTGYVTFVLEKPGEETIYKRFQITKIKAGVPGLPGASAAVYRGALSSDPVNPNETDYYLSTTNNTTPVRAKGRIYQYDGSDWIEATNDPALRAVAMQDMFELAQNTPTGTVEAADIFAQQLISMQATIEALQTKVLQFEESVSSIARATPQAGDLQIYMGKDPRRPNDINRKFEFALKEYVGENGLAENSEVWMNHFFTKFMASGLLAILSSGCMMSPQLLSSPANVWNVLSSLSFGTDRVYGLAVDDIGTIVAVGAKGKIKRSTDGGITWSSYISNPYYNYPNPVDRFDIYNVEFSNGVFYAGNNGMKSLNGGSTWSLTNGGSIGSPYAKSENSIIKWETLNPILRRSTDEGLTWSDPLTHPITGTMLDGRLHYVEGIYIAQMSNGLKMCRSLDDGITWGNLITNPLGIIATHIIDANGVLIAAGMNRKIMRSLNGGETWGNVITLPGVSIGVNDLIYADGIVVAVMEQDIIVSYDKGNTWTQKYLKNYSTGYDLSNIIYNKRYNRFICIDNNSVSTTAIYSDWIEAGSGIISRSTQNGWEIREFSDGTKLRVQNINAITTAQRSTPFTLANSQSFYTIASISVPAGKYMLSASIYYFNNLNYAIKAFSFRSAISKTNNGSNTYYGYVQNGETSSLTIVEGYNLNSWVHDFTPYPIDITTTTVFYLVAQYNGNGNNGMQAMGRITAVPI